MAILKIRDKTGNIIDIPALQGPKGDSGKSIYEIACDNGFNGTEQEWLDGYTPNVIFVNYLYDGSHLASTVTDPAKIYLFIPGASLPGNVGSGLCLARAITVYDNETSETIIKTIKVTNTETLDVYDYDIATDAFTCVNQAGIKNYSDHVRWYIDGAAGDDKWGDGTADRPWKTIDHFFKQANKVTTDIRCYIVSAGRYDIVSPVINGVTIHITATVPGVELYSTKENEALAFYNCHLNFQGVSSTEPLIINSAYGHWYSENCTNTFKYICSEVRYTQYGGTIDVDECTLYKASLQGVNGQISKCTYTITDPTESCLDITEGSVMRLTGTTTFAERSEPGTGNSCFIYAIGSVVSILHGVSTLTNQPAYGLRMDNCFLTITTQRLNYYQNRSIHGNYFGLSNLIVTENINLVEALNNKFNYKYCTALAATSSGFENLLKTSEYYQNNGVYIYQNNVYINSYYDKYIKQYKINGNVLYYRYSNNNGSSWSAFTSNSISAMGLAITDTNNIYTAGNVNNALQEVKLQADATNANVTTIESRVTAAENNIDRMDLCADYEVGDWDSGNVWYAYEEGKVANRQCVGTGPYQLSYDYCILEATVHKVIEWQTIYYSLPVACTYHVEFQITASDGKTYKIKTLDKSGVPVVEITDISGGMTGNWGDTISFTLRYKYR